jgi:proteasome assembly chaperone (PAC2) family protein
MEILHIPLLRAPIMVVAFTGWNDAAEAATGAVSHLLGCWTDPAHDVVPELIAELDSEDFYDFQVNRPTIVVDESSVRSLTWPTTQVFGLQIPELENDFIIVRGVEPSMKWKTFSSEILDLADDLEVEMVITLGSMLADTPHTRPITVSGSGAHLDAISLWAAVPHYASNTPSPKATLALVNSLEDFLEISIPQGELPDESIEWENEVTDLAKEDSDVAEYVKALEESKDSSDLPEATGESIARELERFLRRQSGD